MLAVQYIHRSNQEILWQTFCQIHEFGLLSQIEKEQIFKNTLMNMYEYLTKNVKNSQLKTLLDCNKQTIILFSSQKQQQIPAAIKQNPINQRIPEIQNRLPEPNQMKVEFDKRQDEYSQMNKKPEIQKPVELISEKYEDKIENMEEVLKQYQQERNLQETMMEEKEKEKEQEKAKEPEQEKAKEPEQEKAKEQEPEQEKEKEQEKEQEKEKEQENINRETQIWEYIKSLETRLKEMENKLSQM
jgi:hypothetical protein